VGHVRGKIVKVHKKNAGYEGYSHHASADDRDQERQNRPPNVQYFSEIEVLKSLKRRDATRQYWTWPGDSRGRGRSIPGRSEDASFARV
jgi:hypothetical protein